MGRVSCAVALVSLVATDAAADTALDEPWCNPYVDAPVGLAEISFGAASSVSGHAGYTRALATSLRGAYSPDWNLIGLVFGADVACHESDRTTHRWCSLDGLVGGRLVIPTRTRFVIVGDALVGVEYTPYGVGFGGTAGIGWRYLTNRFELGMQVDVAVFDVASSEFTIPDPTGIERKLYVVAGLHWGTPAVRTHRYSGDVIGTRWRHQ